MLVLRVDGEPVWPDLILGTLPCKTKHRELSDKQVALLVVLHQSFDTPQYALHMSVRDDYGFAGCEEHVVLGYLDCSNDLAHCVEGLDHLGDRPVAVHESAGLFDSHACEARPIIFYVGRVGAVEVPAGRVRNNLSVSWKVFGIRHVHDTA